MSTKRNVLELLESKRGQNVSGEYIASLLKVSRNSVWKAVKELEREGYKIRASTNKGYCLCENNDILSVQGIRPFLSEENTANIYVYEVLESTNKTAKEMAISGATHGTIIIADSQTMGKGRYSRGFFSPPGKGIYMSLVLRPKLLWFNTITLVTLYAAVFVSEAIEEISNKSPRIKWVNDIFLDGKKVCGILTEAVTDLESGNIEWIVVGIGINFSMTALDFPENLRRLAGTVFEDNPPTTRNHLVAKIANMIVTPLKEYSEKEMLEKYKQRMLMLGEKVLITGLDEESYEAIAVDIDDTGRLIIKKDNGEILCLSSGEISMRFIE